MKSQFIFNFIILVFGARLRQDFCKRFTFQYFNEDTRKTEYFFKTIPSKIINDVSTLEGMWTLDEVPEFILERGDIDRPYFSK